MGAVCFLPTVTSPSPLQVPDHTKEKCLFRSCPFLSTFLSHTGFQGNPYLEELLCTMSLAPEVPGFTLPALGSVDMDSHWLTFPESHSTLGTGFLVFKLTWALSNREVTREEFMELWETRRFTCHSLPTLLNSPAVQNPHSAQSISKKLPPHEHLPPAAYSTLKNVPTQLHPSQPVC